MASLFIDGIYFFFFIFWCCKVLNIKFSMRYLPSTNDMKVLLGNYDLKPLYRIILISSLLHLG